MVQIDAPVVLEKVPCPQERIESSPGQKEPTGHVVQQPPDAHASYWPAMHCDPSTAEAQVRMQSTIILSAFI